MVALSILFSYGLQFCVPSEIVWSRLEPWLRKRRQHSKYGTSNKESSVAAVSTIAGNTTITGTGLSATSNMSIDEKKRLEMELEELEKPMDGAYYVMRGSMILGTGTQYIYYKLYYIGISLPPSPPCIVDSTFCTLSTCVRFPVFIAALVPDLAPFISLIGAVFFSILGLMCPAVIHLFAFWEHNDETGEDYDEASDSEDDLDFDGDYYAVDDDTDLDGVQRQQQRRRRSSGRSTRKRRGMSRWTAVKDLAIVMVALIALVSGTYASLVDIVAFYGAGGGDGERDVNGTYVATTTIGPGPESAL